MSAYLPSSRTWRPQTFEEVVGQDPIVTTLKNSLRTQKTAHAYLFAGPRGSGKTTLARVFAKSLNCKNLNSNLAPCNQCSTCQEITASRSLDVIEIDGASNRSIDDMRTLTETACYAPATCRYKIYIIDEVHMLTKEAFNALLKTLEEPPKHVKFLFATTEPHKVLITILSRCQRFDLRRLSVDEITDKLERIAKKNDEPIERESLNFLALKADGSMRDAESLLDQIFCLDERPITLKNLQQFFGHLPQEVFFTLDKAMHEQDLSYGFTLAQEIYASGKEGSFFLEELTSHIRRLLQIRLNSCKSPSPAYTSSASLYSTEQLLTLLDYLLQWSQEYAKSPFKRSLLETILLHLIKSKQRITYDALITRLLALEGKTDCAPDEPMKKEQAPAAIQQEPPQPKIHLDTLLQFAAIELEGSIKRG